ncbi:ABC transporter ATP-binding protein [Trichococcus ilyis]|uniref:ABC transport system ATP-binding protein n=1 Tax=Trichococcus ilyis TaxID=640938 RepID=A0A143YHG7_9LACT|nr:ATP-binding cassette domain-containing protein [Trichococcus ilyis]CZQ87145.1 abc transporter [Trichococcus ilyis]SEI63759.1 putative ABC transport system ATP-binding protein [Trichococcus ilyis]
MALLEMKHLSFVSDGKVILDDISYSLEEGAFLSITGPSGSGKSTLLKIIATILSRTEGEIRYNGKSLDDYEPTDYRKEVSYTFQTPVLFGKTVRDNLAFPYEIRKKEFDEKKAISYLESVGLPKEYLDKEINTLSGGEKQRVALIRNVLFQPKILLLDEVTSALDEANRQIIWKWLHELRAHSEMTIIMVSHNEEESSLADNNIHIVAGKIVKEEAK